MLSCGENPVPCDAAYDDACPELANYFQEKEWAETIERHLFFWTLGLGALPAPFHPFGRLQDVPQL